MADEYQNRKDIDNLYDIVYGDSKEYQVLSKDEFEAHKTELIETFIKSDTVDELVSALYGAINELDVSKANATHTHSASEINDGTAHSNIGSSADDDQATINSAIDTALSGKANATTWTTIHSGTDENTGVSLLLEVNGIHVRLTATGTAIDHPNGFTSKYTVSASYYDYFPQFPVYSIIYTSEGDIAYRFKWNSSTPHTGYFQVKSKTGSTVTEDIKCVLEWTI